MNNTRYITREKKIEKMLYGDVLYADMGYLLKELLRRQVKCYLIGGAVRDAIEGRNPRDLDIIIADDDRFLKDILDSKNIKYKRNAFRGYKLFFENTTVDIWSMKDHYVFKEHIYKETKANLSKSTFINFDSLIYDLQKKDLNSRYYDECVEKKVLDIIGNSSIIYKNPNPILSILKLLIIKQRYNYQLSIRVRDFIACKYIEIGDNLWDCISTEYERHYLKHMDSALMTYIEHQVMEAVSDNFARNHQRKEIKGQYNLYDFAFKQ